MTASKNNNAIRDVLAFLFRHWRQEKAMVALTVAGMAAATCADLVMPVYSGRLIDAIASAGASRGDAMHAALHALVLMALLGVMLVCGRHLGFFAIIRLTTRLMTRFAGNAFWRVQRFSTDWHANNFAGSIVRRVTRGMWATDLMNDTLLLALLPAVVVLVGSSVLLGLHWPMMGGIVAAGALLYITLSITLSLRYVAPAARLSNALDTRIGGAMADAVTCNPVVKAFGAEKREDLRLSEIVDKWSRRTFRTWTRGTRSGTVQLTVLLALRITVILYALLLWWRGRATPGDVAFVLTSYFIIHGYLRDIGQHVANLQRSVNDMEEMVEMESLPLGIVDREGAKPIRVHGGDIRFDRVTFRYGAHATPLFEDFSLHIPGGQRVGLVGHSGSGKTTFVKLLHRLYDINAGSILVDGQNIASVMQDSLRAQMALVPQEPILFHRSLAENIAYGRPHATREQIEEAARLAHAEEFILRQPKGYATLVGERGVKLSGGERQRIALARAFLADTPVLILDEATSSLDSESEALIQEATERLMVGRTAIVIAHRLSTVRMLDRILVFDHGEVVEEGTHEDLVRREDGVYKRLFDRQALGLLVGDIEEPQEEDAVESFD
ncbi:MAG: ABC transporter ATP-binding protein [Edaphobacter sp.]|uniref:ABC transporter ATP-binding protein n=1 Tax=Edaphobacter sp. TaxID=1934404 RepID=UPI0023A6419C|nr:ABC transporter ATP-binding protein [Edaphobacter sp.]MDE1177969.1 ABC transporter ATP-binding protein [Edaphobacter sp.]